jgi:hypothetical protein
MNMTDKQKLAFSAYTGESATKSRVEMNEAIREAVKEACGGEWNFYNFMKNRYDVYALIAELMPVAMHASLAGKFDRFAEFRDTAMGDKNYFEVEDNQIYPLFTAARGTQDIERQKLIDRNFSVATIRKTIKFYDEFDRFMAGKIDFARLTDRAAVSYENYIGLLISNTIYGSYSSVDTEYKATGAFDASTFVGIMENVKASNAGVDNLQIWGTATALGNIADGFGYSERQKESANAAGYYDSFRGSDMFALPQAYLPQTQTFGVNTSYVIILPANEKIVKVAFEGEVYVNSTDGSERNDMQPEFVYARRVGAAALTVPEGKYGLYIFQ